jgi:hypothetical protein
MPHPWHGALIEGQNRSLPFPVSSLRRVAPLRRRLLPANSASNTESLISSSASLLTMTKIRQMMSPHQAVRRIQA